MMVVSAGMTSGKADGGRWASKAVRTVVGAGALAVSGIAVGRTLASRGEIAIEAQVAQWLRQHRGPRQDTIALVASWLTDVPRAIAGSVVVVGALRRTGRRDVAAAAGVAVVLASVVHISTSMAVARPRPELERLGTRQITSSYPSGHVGAITAQCFVLAKMAHVMPIPARRLASMACVGAPLVVGWSRVYTGQHYASDVLAGYANGLVCGRLATRAPWPVTDAAYVPQTQSEDQLINADGIMRLAGVPLPFGSIDGTNQGG